MDKFSLDDVRDSFAADIAAQIRGLSAAARTLAETPCIDWRPSSEGQAEFAAIGRACHTIYGTSSLVGVRSLYESARLLHIVGNLGEECLRAVEDQLKLVRALVVIARHGGETLDRLLELELDHRSDEAWEEALRLREELGRWDDARRELEARRQREEEEEARDDRPRQAERVPPRADDPPSEAAGEFDFDDEPEGRGAMRAPAEVARAAEFSFDDAPESAPAVTTPEPQSSESHTEAPAAEPPPSEFSFDSFAGEPPGPAAAEDRPAEVEGEPGGEFSFPETVEPPSDDLREVFQQEAREYLVALQGYLQSLARDAADTASAASLERIFHTLKGTAATVGLSEVSAQAGALQDTVEEALARGQAFGPALLAQVVERTNALLAAGGLPLIGLDSPARVVDASRSPELQRLFWDDATGSLEPLRAGLAQLEGGTDPDGAIETLRGIFHRLKGSALMVSETAIAECAARLQELCRSGVAKAHPQELARGVDQLARLLSAGQTPLPPVPQREAVTFDLDPVLAEAFDIESGELLEQIERTTFALEASLSPKGEINALFRHYHTLKGSVNTVGLGPLGRLLHRLEDFLEELQQAPILPPLSTLATLLLNVQEEVRRNLKFAKRGFLEVDLGRFEAEIAQLRAGGRVSSARVSSGAGFPGRSDISGRSDSGMGRVVSKRERATDSAIDRKFVRVSTERLDGLMNLTGELVVSRSRLARRVTALQTMHRELTMGRSRLIRAVDRFRESYEFERVGRRGAAVAAGAGASTVAMPFGELELDRYGDVNILARTLADIGHDISQVQGRMTDSLGAFSEDAASFGAIVSGLQVEITQARMVPVEQLFARLRLPVRDAGEREGKVVRVVTSGEDVDLDKAIIDELYTPLLHLVRNAVAHGIERPDRRRTSGKEETGTITLAARQEAGALVLEVQDDGAGLDSLRLYDMAVERGLLPPGTSVDDPAVADVIFVSGVSTRDDVDEVSGRGVGCDVVRREIERLGGQIRVSSLHGLGTTFTITLPLTLAITRALVVRQRGQSYAVALNLTERIVDLQEATVHESAGVRRLNVDGVYHTLRSLDALLALPARRPDDEAPRAAVLLRVGQNRLAVEVDRIVGQEEIVVKGLGDVLTGHPLFSGVTVSGDGELILILDVLGLLHKERRGETSGEEPVAAAPAAAGLRVLFVDDSLSVRKVAERFLAALGVQVTLAADGQEGLELLRGTARFDLVFTDLEMPRLHGYDLIREVRALPARRDLPVVVVTSRSGQKHRDQATALGATDYITKPFSQELLGGILRKWARTGKSS